MMKYLRSTFCWSLFVLIPAFAAASVTAAPSFDTSNPISFFTNVASRLLSSEMNVNLDHIQVYPTNQYTPSVHRLLQVTANIYDATTTNFYPTVFRPLFSSDATGTNVFISGYQQVVSVTGVADPQLARPLDAAALAAGVPFTNLAVNVYGIPWIVGVKKGLPSFDQLYMLNEARVTRKVEVTRNTLDFATADYQTNQMYVLAITNHIGLSFWNSYSNDYPRPLTLFASDFVQMKLTNGIHQWNKTTNFELLTTINSWPGSYWGSNNMLPPNQMPDPNSFRYVYWTFPSLPESIYRLSTGEFVPLTAGQPWETNLPLWGLDHDGPLGLAATNCLQAFILDGNHVIDYVQLCGPTDNANLNQLLADPNYPNPYNPGQRLQWSTNLYGPPGPLTYGVFNQLCVSQNPTLANGLVGNPWIRPPDMPPSLPPTPLAEAAYFNGFFYPYFQFNGKLYVNTALSVQAPYTPTRTMYDYVLWQADDPLVHYLGSDLAYRDPLGAGWHHSDSPTVQPIPGMNPTTPGKRYQPWGLNYQMAGLANVDANPYNFAFKDPLVWSPDDWDFPTGQTWNPNWLGRVHRGTPWQTIYLKSPNVLMEYVLLGGNTTNYIGTNTWMAWTGVPDRQDAQLTSPASDWQLVSLLAALLNTNDLRTQFSVNNPDPNAWAALLDGLAVLTNTTPDLAIYPGAPQFDSLIISSNSTQASLLANAIQSARAGQPNALFRDIGDVLAAPELTWHSPYLNWNNSTQQKYGISDEAYEAIPSQLLPLLRADSIGTVIFSNGEIIAQFSGYDGHAYAIQVSPDLIHWTSISTNTPANGIVNFTISATGDSSGQFYRSLLLQ